MLDEINSIRSNFEADISGVISALQLLEIKSRYLGKEGVFSKLFIKARGISDNSKKLNNFKLINNLFSFIDDAIKAKQKFIQDEELKAKLAAEKLDMTYPGRGSGIGVSHFISKTIDEAIRIFNSMGFSCVSGTEIEDEYHVFDALNTPKHHPARQMQDSFYIEGGKRMLRTHTSSVQVRVMEGSKPPLRIISIGRVYRNDWDATHTPMFHQVEGLCIDDAINMSSMKTCIDNFLSEFFGSPKSRMRPSYFPFTEPSAEVDIQDANGKWLEVLGCGMVHPNVLKNASIDNQKYKGFAFGMGVERITMLKYNIRDLRNFFSGDLRWGMI